MSAEVSNPLSSIISKLAQTPVQGPASQLKKRFTDASSEIVVLLDVSGSMTDTIGSLDLSKYEHLKIALQDVMQAFPKIKLVAFGGLGVRQITDTGKLPQPMGSTPLAEAFAFAAKWKPLKTIVISDGLPDSPAEALEEAQRLTGSIDTIYCGPDAHPAVDFLRQLARDTGGVQVVWDGYKAGIGSLIRGLLPAPGAAIVTPAPE